MTIQSEAVIIIISKTISLRKRKPSVRQLTAAQGRCVETRCALSSRTRWAQAQALALLRTFCQHGTSPWPASGFSFIKSYWDAVGFPHEAVSIVQSGSPFKGGSKAEPLTSIYLFSLSSLLSTTSNISKMMLSSRIFVL